MRRTLILMTLVLIISGIAKAGDFDSGFVNPIFYLMYGYNYELEEYEEAEAETLEKDFKNCIKNHGGNACYNKYKVDKTKYMENK